MQHPAIRRYLDHLILLLLAVVCYILFFHGLRDIGFVGPDEPRYAAVAREMFLTGDYITPRLQGVPWFEKPVLIYWGAALGYALFGVNELGARFPSAIGATFCVFMVYFCGRKLWGRTVGLFAALVMASSVGFFSFARAAATDMPLTACLTAALLFFLIAFNESGLLRRRWFYGFYACLGLGLLAKGPVAVGLPAASLLGFSLSRGLLAESKTWHPKGLWVTLAVAAPWYIACAWVNGYGFVQEFFVNHNVERFITEMYGHARPLYFYGPVLLMLTFPWTFLLIPAVRRRFDHNDQILFWWAVVPLVFFSISGSKLPGYSATTCSRSSDIGGPRRAWVNNQLPSPASPGVSSAKRETEVVPWFRDRVRCSRPTRAGASKDRVCSSTTIVPDVRIGKRPSASSTNGRVGSP